MGVADRGCPAHPAGKTRRRLLRRGGIAVAVLFALDIAYLASAGFLFTVRDAAGRADIIVVIGGDGPPRAARAAELWHAGIASRILVSGAGDCEAIRDSMVQRGVPDGDITIECSSRSTAQNAAYSAPILAQLQVRSAVLVTSWWHSRRAITCFSETAPDIRWISVPARERPIAWMIPYDPEGMAVLKESLKTIWYSLARPCAPEKLGPDRQAGTP